MFILLLWYSYKFPFRIIKKKLSHSEGGVLGGWGNKVWQGRDRTREGVQAPLWASSLRGAGAVPESFPCPPCSFGLPLSVFSSAQGVVGPAPSSHPLEMVIGG